MLYGRREIFNKILEKVGKYFSKLGLSPNQWTGLSFLPAITGFYFVYMGFLNYAVVVYALAVFVDIVDGSVARYKGRSTKKGAYLDTIADRYVEFIILFSMLFITLPKLLVPSEAWITLILFGSLITTYSKSAAKEKEILTEELKGGILERAERVILLVFALILGMLNGIWMVGLLILLALLTNISAFQRISKALGMCDD
jgi:phosphatidylglycerophosphate synthase